MNNLVKGENDFETHCKNNGLNNVLAEWNYEMNNKLPSEYSYGSGKKVWWKCKKGHEWEAVISSRSAGCGCPFCSGNIKKTHKVFVQELSIANPNVEVIGEYKGARIPITVKCKLCSNEWKSSPTNLLRKRKCPSCSIIDRGIKHRKPSEEILNRIVNERPDVSILGEYKTTSSKILTRCNRCNGEWEVAPRTLLRGSGCPYCNRIGTSFVEQLILLSLQEILPNRIISRDRKAIGMELDIYIPEKNAAIEYGAWNWHKDKKKKDDEKRIRCQDKGINLIQIFDAYDDIIPENSLIWCYQENFGKKENIMAVKTMIIRLCEFLDVDFNITDSKFDELKLNAHNNSRKYTKSELNSILSEKNIQIVFVEEYIDMLTKIEARCNICSHQWKVIPASILRGLGCPKCAISRRSLKMRKSKSDFIKELSVINPNIIVLGDYVNGKTNIDVKCSKHNVEFYATPKSLLKGTGCKICTSQKLRKQAKTHTQFVDELKLINSNLIPLTTYINSKTPIRIRCNQCFKEWYAIPSGLIKSGYCPICSKKQQSKRRTKTHVDFVLQLREINKHIEVLSPYICSKQKILVRCKKCLFEWESVPSSLLQGTGCPQCASNKKKTNFEFIQQMSVINPNIKILGEYSNAKTPIQVKCILCGNVWDARPTNLLSKKGCPMCNRINKNK